MRLINTSTLRLEEFGPQNVPEYAILSHRWIDGQEISFEEMRGSPPMEKSGYTKIKQCCKQARKDGFAFAWVDTCCIDKSSSSELSESINSMFRWYAGAQVCYAYLEDVPDQGNWNTFQSSIWFTRGWTLQELLSPSSLIFYSAGWEMIGYRSKLSREVSQITGIEQSILKRHQAVGHVPDLSDISVAQRMSWAGRRETSREEDMTYSLLGVFGVSMSLLYGEGGKEAFRRLQEEIIKTSNDNSIFAWAQPETRGLTHLSALATAAPQFAYSSNVPVIPGPSTSPTELTNEAIKVTIHLEKIRSRWYGILKPHGYHSVCDYAIPLEEILPNTFVRLAGQLIILEDNWTPRGTPKYVSLVNRPGKFGEILRRAPSRHTAVMVRSLPPGYLISSVGRYEVRENDLFLNRPFQIKGSTWVEIRSVGHSETYMFCIHPRLAGDERRRKWREEWVYSTSSREVFELVTEKGRQMAERPAVYRRGRMGDRMRVRVEARTVDLSLTIAKGPGPEIYLDKKMPKKPISGEDVLVIDVTDANPGSFDAQKVLQAKTTLDTATKKILYMPRMLQRNKIFRIIIWIPKTVLMILYTLISLSFLYMGLVAKFVQYMVYGDYMSRLDLELAYVALGRGPPR